MDIETRLGPDHILEPLGAGGMGEVWLAPVPLRRMVAALNWFEEMKQRVPTLFH